MNVSSAVHILSNPLTIMCVFGAIAFFIFALNRRRLARTIFLTGVVFTLAIAFTPIPLWLIDNLESQFEPFESGGDLNCKRCKIFVLAGGYTISSRLPASSQLIPSALSRLVEGIRVHQLLRESVMVFSGGARPGMKSQAEVTAAAALELGVGQTDTLQIRQSSNTLQELKNYRERFGVDSAFVLVTSAYHMPRAMSICKELGMMPIPAPTDFYIKDRNGLFSSFLPSAEKTMMFSVVTHEYGAAIYRTISGDD